VPGDADLELVDRALTGDTQAFEDLVRRHECRVFRTTVILPGNADDAEEALQDAFLYAYQHLGIALHAPKLRDGIYKFMDPKATPLSRRNRR
jgi:RNA polymerase sigma-70 factor (ECF subfamily)